MATGAKRSGATLCFSAVRNKRWLDFARHDSLICRDIPTGKTGTSYPPSLGDWTSASSSGPDRRLIALGAFNSLTTVCISRAVRSTISPIVKWASKSSRTLCCASLMGPMVTAPAPRMPLSVLATGRRLNSSSPHSDATCSASVVFRVNTGRNIRCQISTNAGGWRT